MFSIRQLLSLIMSDSDSNFLKITTDTYYGKLLGGCVYAGLPISKTITIKLSDDIFVELECFMFINEDLNYYVSFTWTERHNWTDCPFSYLRQDFKVIIAKINSSEFDWKKESFLDIGFDVNIITDDPIFCLGDVNIKLTPENRPKIDQFLNQFKEEMITFLKETEVLYISCKDIIGWERELK